MYVDDLEGDWRELLPTLIIENANAVEIKTTAKSISSE